MEGAERGMSLLSLILLEGVVAKSRKVRPNFDTEFDQACIELRQMRSPDDAQICQSIDCSSAGEPSL